MSEPVLVETESFDELGGWVLDQQFMDQMGSPFLLAHGAGAPVVDASTFVSIPRRGAYRVWVRTRDWCASRAALPTPGTYSTGSRPGAFEVLVDGRPLGRVFGTAGNEWHWEDGGIVSLDRTRVRLSLRDLTGFDARCDAIALSADPDFVPPNADPEMGQLRQKLLGLATPYPSGGNFDLVVVGGGLAGICAAVTAARRGLRVALVQDRPVLGGNNSSEVRVRLEGRVGLPPCPRLGDVVREIDAGESQSALPGCAYGDQQKLGVVRREPNLQLFSDTRVVQAVTTGSVIREVVGQHVRTASRLRFEAPLFADCTGDGCVGALAGAEFRLGREAQGQTGEPSAPASPDNLALGTTLLWYARRMEEEQYFPEIPWAVQFSDSTCLEATSGAWNWETGMCRDQVLEGESIRDHMLRAIYGNWAFLKNRSRHRSWYSAYALEWVGYISGKRESRRLMGDVVVAEQDFLQERRYPDGCVPTSWPIDLHYPEAVEGIAEEPFLSRAEQRPVAPFAIPYRSLYSRNVENLLMAGRDISVTHIGLGAVRVMRTTGMMGEVIGHAAAIATRRRCGPRGVYERHLPELLRQLSGEIA